MGARNMGVSTASSLISRRRRRRRGMSSGGGSSGGVLVIGGTSSPGEAAVSEETVRLKNKVDEEMRERWRRRWGVDVQTKGCPQP